MCGLNMTFSTSALRRLLMCFCGLSSLAFSDLALAQGLSMPKSDPYPASDEFNFNVLSGTLTSSPISIGLLGQKYDISVGKVDSQYAMYTYWTDNYKYRLYGSMDVDPYAASLNVFYSSSGICSATVNAGSSGDSFIYNCNDNSPTFNSDQATGATLVGQWVSSSEYRVTYADKYGNKSYFSFSSPSEIYASTSPSVPNNGKSAYLVDKVDGERLTIAESGSYIAGTNPFQFNRQRSVVSTKGYTVRFGYDIYGLLSNVKLVNASFDYCGGGVGDCPATANVWPSLQISNPGPPGSAGAYSVADATGKMNYFEFGPSPDQSYFALNLRNSAGDKIAYTNWSASYMGIALGGQAHVQAAGKIWNYLFSTDFSGSMSNRANHTINVTRTDPNGFTREYNGNPSLNLLYSIKDENGRITKQIYDAGHQLKYILPPEATVNANGDPVSGYVQLDHDARGNLVQTIYVPKSGSALANVVTSAGYDAVCNNQKTCNKPNWVKDAKGGQTDYTYDASHGGVLSEMGPAPSSVDARPLKLTTYVQRYASIKNSAGNLVQADTAIWVKGSETSCQTQAGANPAATCDSSTTITTTTYEYGATGTWQSLLVKGLAISSSGTTLRTCFAYDQYGNKLSETAPRANLTSCP